MRETFELYWDEITAWAALIDIVLIFPAVAWVLTIKEDSMSAMAWCLVIVLLPFVGTVLFVLLGWQQVHRPLSRKTRHKEQFRTRFIDIGSADLAPDRRSESAIDGPWSAMARLASQLDASPVTPGNRVHLYFEGEPAFAAKREAMRAARHHIHLEYFIFQPDDLGTEVLQILTEKVKQGVEVRLLYDAMGSRRLHRRMLSGLLAAGGKCRSFLPLDPLRRRIQINMRNHRKILVVDGEVAFTGGLTSATNTSEKIRGSASGAIPTCASKARRWPACSASS
jgi:cardiolipin synthase